MSNTRIVAALFAIAIASSLVVVSGFVGSASASAYAAKKVKQHEFSMTLAVPFSGLPAVLDKDKSISRISDSANAGDSDWTIRSASSIPINEMSVWREICNT
jgi:hypothetical protein